MKVGRGIVATIGCVVVIFALSGAARAQNPASSDVMNALLNEVHALRVAMEQQATVVPRIQLSLARLNIEEQRLLQLSQQLDQVRHELSTTTTRLQQLATERTDLEDRLRMETDEAKKKQMSMQLADTKMGEQRNTAEQQQLQARESESTRALDTEQARWIGINNQIDELEKTLGPVRKPE